MGRKWGRYKYPLNWYHKYQEVEGKSFEAVFDDPFSFGEPECIKVSESGPLEPLKRLNTT
jgi:hypothetical protein